MIITHTSCAKQEGMGSQGYYKRILKGGGPTTYSGKFVLEKGGSGHLPTLKVCP